MARKDRMNDDEREDWIMNDEGLYDQYVKSGLSMRAFIRKMRGEIDEVRDNVVSGQKPAHYLKYGG